MSCCYLCASLLSALLQGCKDHITLREESVVMDPVVSVAVTREGGRFRKPVPTLLNHCDT